MKHDLEAEGEKQGLLPSDAEKGLLTGALQPAGKAVGQVGDAVLRVNPLQSMFKNGKTARQRVARMARAV